MKNITFTVKKLMNFNDCQKKYLLAETNPFPKDKKNNNFFAFDYLLHKAIDLIHIHEEVLITSADINLLLDSLWDHTLFSSFDASEFFYRRLKKYLKVYTNNLKDSGETLLTSKYLTFRLGASDSLKVKIDRVFKRNDGEYEVIDYKSGKKISHTKALSKNLQVPISILAVSKHLKVTPIYFSYYYLANNIKFTYKLT